MKRLIYLFFFTIVISITSVYADEITLDQTQDLKTAILTAPEGSVIVLLDDGGVYPCSLIEGPKMIANNITIKAAPGLSVKPTIQYVSATDNNSFFFLKDGGNVTFEGVKIDGGNTTFFIFMAQYTNLATINLIDCDFTNVTNQAGSSGAVIASKKGTTSDWSVPVGSVNISNCRFYNVPNQIVYCTSAAFDKITVSNCLITGNASTEAFSNINTKPNSYEFDHITFNGRNFRELNTTSNISSKFSNIIFANSTYTAKILIPGNITSQDKIAFYNYSTNKNGLLATIDGVDPKFGVKHIATDVQYVGAGTDGKTIGYFGDGTGDLTSLIKNSDSSNFKIFPTAVERGRSISVSGVSDNVEYVILSLTGSVINSGKVSNGLISIDNINSGIYLVKIYSSIQKIIIR